MFFTIYDKLTFEQNIETLSSLEHNRLENELPERIIGENKSKID